MNKPLIEEIEHASCSFNTAEDRDSEICRLIERCQSIYELQDALKRLFKLLPAWELANWIASLLRARMSTLQAEEEFTPEVTSSLQESPSTDDDGPSPF